MELPVTPIIDVDDVARVVKAINGSLISPKMSNDELDTLMDVDEHRFLDVVRSHVLPIL